MGHWNSVLLGLLLPSAFNSGNYLDAFVTATHKWLYLSLFLSEAYLDLSGLSLVDYEGRFSSVLKKSAWSKNSSYSAVNEYFSQNGKGQRWDHETAAKSSGLLWAVTFAGNKTQKVYWDHKKTPALRELRISQTSTAIRRIFLAGAHFPAKSPKIGCERPFPTSSAVGFMLSRGHIVSRTPELSYMHALYCNL